MTDQTDQSDQTDQTELVHYRVDGAVASLVLDSPANRNALSRALVAQLADGLQRAERDEDVRVVVVRAEGPAFCSGADLSEATGEGMEGAAQAIVALQRRIVTLEKPVVVQVHGPCRAGGIGIVAAADVVVAAEAASFALTEVRLGLAAAMISLTVLPRLTDRAAAWACLGGEVFDAATAQTMGLVTRTVPAEDLLRAVDETCVALAKGHPQGLRESKRLLNRHLVERIDRDGEDLAALSARLFGSDAAREAMTQFLHRRSR